MKQIKLGSTGNDVKKWQYFLLGQELYPGPIHGKFDEAVNEATKKFQLQYQLKDDGIVGNKTVGQAMLLGFGLVVNNTPDDRSTDAFPPKPGFAPLVSNAERQRVFGKMEYVSDPQPKNPESIKITNNWAKENIVKISVRQLIPIKGTDTVYFHKKGANQLIRLFEDWEKAGLMNHVLTWGGTYLPRFVRGSRTSLSNHAYGTAFDINIEWNKLGVVPALAGKKGSVRELVELAHHHGFYWGGHFSRRDGMHFEVAKIIE